MLGDATDRNNSQQMCFHASFPVGRTFELCNADFQSAVSQTSGLQINRLFHRLTFSLSQFRLLVIRAIRVIRGQIPGLVFFALSAKVRLNWVTGDAEGADHRR